MTTTKTPPIYGDHLPITPYQIKSIRALCQFDEDFKCEVVHSHTGQTSLKKLTQKQAVIIIRSFENVNLERNSSYTPPSQELEKVNWAVFDKTNPKHKVILSLMYQMQWVKPSEKWGEIPDLNKLSNFLQSDRSPVKKKLTAMDDKEVQKIIKALNGIIKHIYK